MKSRFEWQDNTNDACFEANEAGERLAQAMRALQEAQQDVERATVALQEAEQAVASAEATVDSAQTSVSSAHTALSEARDAEERASARAALSAATAELSNAKNQLSEARSELIQKQRELSEAKQRCSDAERAEAEAQREVDCARGRIEELINLAKEARDCSESPGISDGPARYFGHFSSAQAIWTGEWEFFTGLIGQLEDSLSSLDSKIEKASRCSLSSGRGGPFVSAFPSSGFRAPLSENSLLPGLCPYSADISCHPIGEIPSWTPSWSPFRTVDELAYPAVSTCSDGALNGGYFGGNSAAGGFCPTQMPLSWSSTTTLGTVPQYSPSWTQRNGDRLFVGFNTVSPPGAVPFFGTLPVPVTSCLEFKINSARQWSTPLSCGQLPQTFTFDTNSVLRPVLQSFSSTGTRQSLFSSSTGSGFSFSSGSTSGSGFSGFAAVPVSGFSSGCSSGSGFSGFSAGYSSGFPCGLTFSS